MNQLDYAAARAQVSIAQVLALIDYRPSRAADDQWRGPCPLCPTPSRPHLRCFSVNLGTNLFQCFRCRRSGNALDLWVALTGLPLYQATLDLCYKLNRPPITIQNLQPPTQT
jgi:hypothetical protein